MATFPCTQRRSDLTGLHSLFRSHQEALLRWEVDDAAEWLAKFTERFAIHVRDEEEVVLPAFQCLISDRPSPVLATFHGDHRNLERFLREFSRRLSGMRGVGTNLAGPLILLFDSEASFKTLLESHRRRAERVLYPALEGETVDQPQGGVSRRAAPNPAE